MHDSITDFALREAQAEELGISLGRSFAEFRAWHAQAMILSRFTRDASTAGVSEVLIERINDGMSLAEEFGILHWPESKSKTYHREIASICAKHQLKLADSGVKLAAIVILHNACEQFLYRLVRFGLVANRDKALEWIAERKVKVGEIAGGNVEALIDNQLENWWNDLERKSLLEKWKALIALVGYPPKLEDNVWHFDRDMLSQFDEIRHNAVHHEGEDIQSFDLDEFAKQLERAHVVWVVHVADKLRLQIPAEVFFGLK